MGRKARALKRVWPSGSTYVTSLRAVRSSAVAVAIVNFNTREHLSACLDSVLDERPDEVVVVDNASSDGSADLVRRRYPEVLLHANPTNRGYGAAANQAVASCRGGYVLLLNGDTRLMPGTLATLTAYMTRHPEAVVVGPLLRRLDGSVERSYFPFPGTLSWLLENAPIAWLLPYLPVASERFLCLMSPTTARVVPWVKGAALMLRRTAFEAVGGFDESYFMYFEEVDLCLRLRTGHGEVHFSPAAIVVHVGGASTSQLRQAMYVAHFRSALQFYRRHYSAPRRAFWISLMKLKMLIRLARDSARLVLASDPHRRAMLIEQISAWAIALRAAPASPPSVPDR